MYGIFIAISSMETYLYSFKVKRFSSLVPRPYFYITVMGTKNNFNIKIGPGNEASSSPIFDHLELFDAVYY